MCFYILAYHVQMFTSNDKTSNSVFSFETSRAVSKSSIKKLILCAHSKVIYVGWLLFLCVNNSSGNFSTGIQPGLSYRKQRTIHYISQIPASWLSYFLVGKQNHTYESSSAIIRKKQQKKLTCRCILSSLTRPTFVTYWTRWPNLSFRSSWSFCISCSIFSGSTWIDFFSRTMKFLWFIFCYEKKEFWKS